MVVEKLNGAAVVKALTLLVFTCIVVHFSASSQVIIEGTVRDAATHAPLYLATVIDQASGEAVLADSTGYYRLDAKRGDTIRYSFLGYYATSYVIPAGLTRIVHDVSLVSRSHTLTEVEIRALSPYQKDSLERLETFKHYLDQPTPRLVDLKSHSVYDVPNPNYNDAFGISINPFTFLSKRGREKRSFKKMYPKFEKQAFISSRYTRELVHKLTGLSGDSLTLFLYKFRPSYEFTRVSSDLVFWSWIKIQYKAWVKPK